MKKKYLFIPEATSWNSLVQKFFNLHKRIKKGNSSEQQTVRMSGKLQSIYKRLERMQYRVGIKLVGSALALMLVSATSFSQDFSSLDNLISFGDISVPISPAPVFADIDGDGDLDLYIGNNSGTIKVFTNDGTETFSAAGNLQADGTDIDVDYWAAPVFEDIDGDDDLDLYVGNEWGHIKAFMNDGTGNFSDPGGIFLNINGYNSVPVFEDIDEDGDLDLYTGEKYGTIKVFTTDGTGNFSPAADLQADGADIDVGYYTNPVFEDIDDDNDLDLYAGEFYGSIKVFTNDGTGNFSAAVDLQATE